MIKVETDVSFKPGVRGLGRKRQDGTGAPSPINRRFIVWDGEGADFPDDPFYQHHYVLFGCRVEGRDYYRSATTESNDLQYRDCFELVLQIAEQFPYSIHVAYAFNYDVNMMIRFLPMSCLRSLHHKGYCYVDDYRIAWRPSKQFTITKYGKGGKRDYQSVTIYDVFTFFAKSMLKAAASILGDEAIPALVTEGKALRGSFKFEEMDSVIIPYWSAENQVMLDMMEKFRGHLYDAGMEITKWYGPGALASYNLKEKNIHWYMSQTHMSGSEDVSSAIQTASQFAYAGGRFELYKVGRYIGDIYSYDINSAYPAAIAQLPCLRHGYWNYGDGQDAKVWKYGLYHVRLSYGGMFEKFPSPLFLRDSNHHIFYPWQVEGWYWSPEAYILKEHYGKAVEFIECWEWVQECDHKPFDWVPDMYETRKQWQAQGNGAQLALKLTLNSLYGKMAQRVGWNTKECLPPSWHQLEWAGWVTSWTRSKLYRTMLRIGYDNLISVETDGIFCAVPPTRVGITDSKELGGWKVDHFNEIIYLQSGFYWVRDDENVLHTKVRGFDPGSIDYEHVRQWMRDVDVSEQQWPTLTGTTSRFVGLGAALMSKAPRVRHCRWEVGKPRTLAPGAEGKRFHFRPQCRACQNDISIDDALHDLVIGVPGNTQSVPHSLPWRGQDNPFWDDDVRRKDYVEA